MVQLYYTQANSTKTRLDHRSEKDGTAISKPRFFLSPALDNDHNNLWSRTRGVVILVFASKTR